MLLARSVRTTKRPERSGRAEAHPAERGPGVLSTRALARAIGVSESSVKRWADGGALRVVRTAGGHRRIPLAEAVRFVRETRATVVEPAVFGLACVDALAAADAAGEEERLHAWLSSGAAAQAGGFLSGLYLGGRSLAAIVDGPLRGALERLGERWLHAADGILVEHRATEICIKWLNQVRGMLAPAEGAPLAVGGAPTGDPYALPTLAVAAALEAEGLHAINLGPETPLGTLQLAIERERPAIAWLSVSTDAGRDAVARDLQRLAEAARASGARLILGGRALRAGSLHLPPGVHLGNRVSELAAFAQGLCAGRRS